MPTCRAAGLTRPVGGGQDAARADSSRVESALFLSSEAFSTVNPIHFI
jgi:hypothetical protein